MKFQAPPIRTSFPQDGVQGQFSRGWQQWLQAISNALTKLFGDPIPEITGSRGGNVPLAQLLTQLQAKGMIVDKTTP